jgi:hypothetical protein
MKKRPRDPNQFAKSIVGIATGEIEDRDPTPEEQGKDPAAVAMGRKGGQARAAGPVPLPEIAVCLTSARSAIAKVSQRTSFQGTVIS